MSNINAQTIIQPGNVSGTWTKAGSPYEVRGDITVPKGSTLTIEPGVVVEFGGRYTVFVDGIVNAEGKKGDSITFKAAPTQTWCGFVFYKNTEDDTIEFNYTRWENVTEKWLTYKGKYPFEWRKLVVLVSRNIFCAYSSPLKVRNSSFYFNVSKKKQANLIYAFKTPLIVDSVYMSLSSDTISTSHGIIGGDSCNFISITNLKVKGSDFTARVVTLSNCVAYIQRPIKISNIHVFGGSKTILTSLYKCRYGELENLYGEKIGQGLILGDCPNIFIRKVFLINAKTAFGSNNNCVGSIVEDCVFDSCGYFGTTTEMGIASTSIHSNGPLFKNCAFINSKIGLGIYQENGPGTPIFLNCLFQGANGRAAGIEANPIFINCNFTNNTDRYYTRVGSNNIPYFGGVSIYREFYNSHPYFYNCLFWGNRDSFGNTNSIVLTDKVVKADLTNCIVQGDSVSGIVGYDYRNPPKFYIPASNLVYKNSGGKAPGFIDSSSGNFHLINSCSQTAYAINRGMSGNLLTQYPFNILKSQYGVDIYKTTDLDGNLRVMDDTIDIGCYESSGNKKALKIKTSYPDTTLCYGASNNYTASTNGSVQSYNWQKKSGSDIITVGTSSTLNLSNIQTANQEFRLFVSNNECLPLRDSSRWFNVMVNNPLKKGIIKTPNKDTIALKDTMQLSTSTGAYQIFLWSNGAKTSSIKFTGSSLGPTGKYRFTLEARNSAGCLETDTTYVITKDNPQGLNEIGFYNLQLVLYPQPAEEILNLLFINGNSVNLTMSIWSMQGSCLYEVVMNGNNHSIDISTLKSGLYILTVVNSITGERAVLRWLKE